MTRAKKSAVKVVLLRRDDGLREYHGSSGDYLVRRVLIRTAYPKSGNVDNPTREYIWVVERNRRQIGTEGSLRGARELIAVCEDDYDVERQRKAQPRGGKRRSPRAGLLRAARALKGLL